MSFYTNDKMLSYGTIPPPASKLFWGNGNHEYFNENDIITSIDLQESLQRLNQTEREVILLFNQGYSKREVAEMINLPETTTQDIKQRATSKLKEMMNGENNIYSVFA